MEFTGGFFSPGRPPLALQARSGTEQAAASFQAWLARETHRSVRLNPAACQIRLAVAPCEGPESYVLRITRSSVEVVGDDEAGLAYGLSTLRQLIRLHGLRLPALIIRDRPAFPHRGYSLDISRGRVPKRPGLKRLVDRLADWKMNQLQLYVEHTFDFPFDREIARGVDALTPEDIRELDQYAAQRHVRLVPSLACFGHMGRLLSLPRYRSLAEVGWPARDWASAPWRLRLRGATINPRNPAARRLLRKMLDDFLPCFATPLFNMCGDETYDLGKGVNAPYVKRYGLGRLYADHVHFLAREAARHGKRLMLWGDVLQHHPEAIARLPRDAVVLDWGYEPDTPFEKAGRFIEAGLETWVCPSTRGYKVVFNRVETARANIAGYARAGVRLGAQGLLLTDWGDMGHFNLPACSLHGLALGASLSWNPATDEGRDFDRTFSFHVLGDRSGKAGHTFAQAGGTELAEWPRLLLEPGHPVSPELARRATRRLPYIAGWKRHTSTWTLAKEDLEEIRRAMEALGLTARRLMLDHKIAASKGVFPASLQRTIRVFCREMEGFIRRYAATWRAGYQPAGWRELQRALRRSGRTMQRILKRSGQ